MAEPTKVIIDSAAGPQTVSVEVVYTRPKIEKGLMYRQYLAPDAGMLFFMGAENDWAFYMRNTLIPLDMVFIDAKGRIQQIVEQTRPHSLELIQSRAPALAVLEIAGGEAKRLGIQPGQLVTHAALVSH